MNNDNFGLAATIADPNDPRDGPSEEQLRDEPQPPLVEGEDYYLENGLYVFMEGFLRRRGYCCESGCRHCPYPKAT